MYHTFIQTTLALTSLCIIFPFQDSQALVNGSVRCSWGSTSVDCRSSGLILQLCTRQSHLGFGLRRNVATLSPVHLKLPHLPLPPPHAVAHVCQRRVHGGKSSRWGWGGAGQLLRGRRLIPGGGTEKPQRHHQRSAQQKPEALESSLTVHRDLLGRRCGQCREC